MKAWRSQYSIMVMARVFEVSRSGFHAWLKRPPSKHRQEDGRRKAAIRAAHEKTRRTYGARRLRKELLEKGFVTGRDRVARLRQEMGIQCKQSRHFKITTQSDQSSLWLPICWSSSLLPKDRMPSGMWTSPALPRRKVDSISRASKTNVPVKSWAMP